MYFGRGKNKYQNCYTVSDFYAYLMDKFEGDPRFENLTRTQYITIVKEFYKKVMERILYKADKFTMPEKMGKLSVIKGKGRLYSLSANCVDWVETVKHGKWIYNLNEHSNGSNYMFFWDKTTSLIPNLYYYRFIQPRGAKRLLAKLIKSRKYDYFEKE